MSAIPYTVEPRPDTGVNNVQLGVWLFLASEVMLFGGLFSAYFMLRAGSVEPWLPMRERLVSALMGGTLNLFIAGAAFAGAVSQARVASGRAKLVLVQLGISILASLAFCAWKWSEYSSLLAAHLTPAGNTRMALYFLLTGVHVLHVLGGVVVDLWLLLTIGKAPAAVAGNRLQATALYWYFVDLVWIVLFVLFYVA